MKPLQLTPDVVARFWPKVAITGNVCECWVWNAGCDRDGYGKFSVQKENRFAHRVAYQLTMGIPPDGTELDHLCRNHSCVNPWHLEAVTHFENMERSIVGWYNSQRTHCPKGHPYEGDNLIVCKLGKRSCRRCARAKQSRYHARCVAARKLGAA